MKQLSYLCVVLLMCYTNVSVTVAHSSEDYYVVKQSNKLVLNDKLNFEEQVNKENFIYEVRHVFDLHSRTVFLPKHITLIFNGGKIVNGYLVSAHTKLINPPDGLPIVRSIYNSHNKEINVKSFTERKGALRIHNSFTMFNESMLDKNLQDKYEFYKEAGMNTLWLCILLEYSPLDNTIKVPSWYTNYHNLGGLKGTVQFLEKELGTQIDCIKLHKNINFSDNINEPKAYYEFCKKVIDELFNLGIEKLFISNEEPQRTKLGSIWIPSFNEIIKYAHSKGIKVGFSMNNFANTVEELDPTLRKSVDMLYENFYPTLSKQDLRTSYDDIPKMVKICKQQIALSINALRKYHMEEKYGISECGIVPKVTALRYPYKWENNSKFDSSGKITDLYWRTIILAAIEAEVKEIANWYMDENNSKIYKKEMIQFIFNSLWK